MAFCLPKEYADKFLSALREGKIVPEKLAEMTSEERRAFLEPYVGKADVKEVNALLESKLILKDQKRGMVSWAKKVAGLTEDTRRDIISKIEKLDRVLDPEDMNMFLEDLAGKRLGVEVSAAEAKNIVDMSRHLTELENEFDGKLWSSQDARLEYGATKVALNNYINELRISNDKITLGGIARDLKNDPVAEVPSLIGKAISGLAGAAKGLKASLDNSAIFRQGWKTLFTNTATWGKNAAKTFPDILTQIFRSPKDERVLNAIKAEIQSRPNAMNGNYERMKLDIGNLEEAYPTSLPEKIPVLGNLYKASETAYTGFLYRMRADIADKLIKQGEEAGLNMKNKEEARAAGRLVNSLTGRGSLGEFEKVGKQINTIFFSPKMLKSQFDFLTGHMTDRSIRTNAFLRKTAAVNILKVVVGTAIIMTLAKSLLGDNAVELDPRSSDFGKIRVGNTRFDISGGMGSVITLAARLTPLLAGQKAYTKSTTTHKLNEINAKNKDGTPKFGAQTGWDVAVDFATNKASPAASFLIDMLRSATFDGGKPTLTGELQNIFVPLPITNAEEVLKAKNGANPLLTIIADALGIATNTYEPKKK